MHDCCEKLYADTSRDGGVPVRCVWKFSTRRPDCAAAGSRLKNPVGKNSGFNKKYRSLFPIETAEMGAGPDDEFDRNVSRERLIEVRMVFFN